jgi:hypothetical protein
MAVTASAHEDETAAATVTAAPATKESRGTAATAVAVTTAAAVKDRRATTATTVTAATSLLLFSGRTAVATIAMAAAGLCSRRGRNRQSGDARGEKQPGHRKLSFRTVKTVRSPHRSTA